jgi:hypothetical protein
MVRAAEPGPLPGEIVTRIGQVAAIPADERKVPGHAGAWRMAAAQRQVLDAIRPRRPAPQALPGRHVTDTVQAAPDLIETRPQRAPRPRAVDRAGLRRYTSTTCGIASRRAHPGGGGR